MDGQSSVYTCIRLLIPIYIFTDLYRVSLPGKMYPQYTCNNSIHLLAVKCTWGLANQGFICTSTYEVPRQSISSIKINKGPKNSGKKKRKKQIHQV